MPSLYDQDIFIGARLIFNDVSDSNLLAGVTSNSSGRDRFINIKEQRRFTNHLKGELRMRLFSNTEQDSILSAFEKDDYLQLQLRYYL